MRSTTDFPPWVSCDLTKWGSILKNDYLVKVKGNNVLFDQGELSLYVYIVKSGRVQLSYFTSNGAEKIFMFIVKGGMFGETSCFESTTQYFHASTIVNCELYKIPANEFLNYLSSDTTLNFHVYESLTNKVHVLAEQMMRISFLDAESRVAAVFVDLASVFGEVGDNSIKINLPVTQQGISDLVRTSQITVGKIIRKFEKSSIIDKRHNRFHIYNLEELKRLSAIR